jgi:hypothetical protein
MNTFSDLLLKLSVCVYFRPKRITCAERSVLRRISGPTKGKQRKKVASQLVRIIQQILLKSLNQDDTIGENAARMKQTKN